MNCPLCSEREASVVYSVPQVPVTCTAAFDTPDEARAVPVGRIDLAVCAGCGFAYNKAFDPELSRIGLELEAAYESSQTASEHFKNFARGLAVEWVERHHLHGRTVIEVGSGGGDFLSQLIAAGVGKVIAIDPLTPTHPGEGGIEVLNEMFGVSHLALNAEALVCRHTLEHVPDVKAFLRLVREWVARGSGRVALFELPSAERVIKEAAFWDIYYEHPNYFTAGTLRRAFEEAGLRLCRLESIYSGQYFLAEAKAGGRYGDFKWPSAEDELRVWADFGARATQAVRKCRAIFDGFTAGGDALVLWQGASKTVGVLAAADIAGLVEYAVDLNQRRQGRYLPSSALPVCAPSTLEFLRPRHVVLMNSVYRDEVQAHLDRIGVQAELCTMNDVTQ